ncbi:small ubiquitin-related modifier 2-like [Vombatus ursinus]|uniref:small ubiquitin-related modifier 2-like n=1 Tax=Vombatus ursinus TaxID=29139 RepID=UPI000FFD3A8E|nr:small ubiquitin-related modifier 2-like [Vombatus ursinus]
MSTCQTPPLGLQLGHRVSCQTPMASSSTSSPSPQHSTRLHSPCGPQGNISTTPGEQPGPAAGDTVAEKNPGLTKKQKEGVKTENDDHINLKVAVQDASVVQFKMKRHTSLGKLMKAYCEPQDTPVKLDMEDEDTIDVFQNQTGGAY